MIEGVAERLSDDGAELIQAKKGGPPPRLHVFNPSPALGIAEPALPPDAYDEGESLRRRLLPDRVLCRP